jgi:hypothetical protein
VGYEGIAFGAFDTLVRSGLPYPRGAYGTVPASHPDGGQVAIVHHLPVRHVDRYRASAVGTWDAHDDFTEAELNTHTATFQLRVDQPGRLQRISWHYREPLEDGQKVAALVRIGDSPTWDTSPDVDGLGGEVSQTDRLWGVLSSGDGTEHGELIPYTMYSDWREYRPVVNDGETIYVRFYFDLGDTHAYNLSYAGGVVQDDGWANMVQVDDVTVELMPEGRTYPKTTLRQSWVQKP